jgi:hypothetical protein
MDVWSVVGDLLALWRHVEASWAMGMEPLLQARGGAAGSFGEDWAQCSRAAAAARDVGVKKGLGIEPGLDGREGV